MTATPFALRPATKADLDAITRVVQAGFPDDPGCDYKFPYRDQYPADFWKWTRLQYEEYLDQPEKYAVLVATTTHAEIHAHELADGSGRTNGSLSENKEPLVIAMAVWDMAVLVKPKGGGKKTLLTYDLSSFPSFASPVSFFSDMRMLCASDLGINERRDANPLHMKVYAETNSFAWDKYLAPYGDEQLNLWWLITHPDFRRRGAGTMLCNWGQTEAIKRGYILSVGAGPMGQSLYEHLGYSFLGSETVQVQGEEESLEIVEMVKRKLV